MDVQLKPGDIVYAVPKKFKFAREVVLGAIETFAETLTGDAAENLYQQDVDPLKLRP